MLLNEQRKAMSEIIVLGSGSSTGVPTPLCVLQPSDPPCSVCHKAIADPPDRNKNYRCNPSIMIRYVPLTQPEEAPPSLQSGRSFPRYIQIDCGKAFREQVLRWYLHHKIPRMDALLLTHEHADAILGLDDIRGLQPFTGPTLPSPVRTPVFVSQHTMDSVIEKFGYLVSDEQRSKLHSRSRLRKDRGAEAKGDLQENGTVEVNGSFERGDSNHGKAMDGCVPATGTYNGSKPAVFRRVTQLDWRVIGDSFAAPFVVEGLCVTPLPLLHGEDYISLGFEFGARDRVIYMSDVSRIPDNTMAYLETRNRSVGRAEVLLIDSLDYHMRHPTHFSFPETLEAIRQLQPRRAFLIGMTHQFDHDLVNDELRDWSQREGIHVELSWDGLSIPVDL